MLSFPFPPKNLSLCFSPTLPLFLGHQVGGWGRKRAHERVSERVETKRKTGKSRRRLRAAAATVSPRTLESEGLPIGSVLKTSSRREGYRRVKVRAFFARLDLLLLLLSSSLIASHIVLTTVTKNLFFCRVSPPKRHRRARRRRQGRVDEGGRLFLLLTRGGGGETPGKKRGGKEEKTFKSARATVKVGKKEEGEEGNGTPQIRTEILQRAESVHAVEKEEDSTSSHRPATVRFDGVRQGAIGSHYALCST